MAVADVPGCGLALRGNATLTDCLAICCLTGELLHVGCHGTLYSGVVGSGGVEQKCSVVCFDHALSIGHLVGSGENGGQCLRRPLPTSGSLLQCPHATRSWGRHPHQQTSQRQDLGHGPDRLPTRNHAHRSWRMPWVEQRRSCVVSFGMQPL